jgi:hypothetical protein
MKLQEVSVEVCQKILNFIKDEIDDDDLQIAVVIFDEEGRRQFGSGCQKCTSDVLFQTASDLASREHLEFNDEYIN